ncbi:MAG TPA: hypothetical protein VMG59_05935 [Phycisphaerae bacterium]|nr:hypothetical protein [Phycisphaerae bacterium]
MSTLWGEEKRKFETVIQLLSKGNAFVPNQSFVVVEAENTLHIFNKTTDWHYRSIKANGYINNANGVALGDDLATSIQVLDGITKGKPISSNKSF